MRGDRGARALLSKTLGRSCCDGELMPEAWAKGASDPPLSSAPLGVAKPAQIFRFAAPIVPVRRT